MSDTKAKITESLKEWGVDLPTFEARAKRSLAEARDGLSDVGTALRETLGEMREKLVDLQKGSGPAAAELKRAFEQASAALAEGFERAGQQMREARKDSRPPQGGGDEPPSAC